MRRKYNPSPRGAALTVACVALATDSLVYGIAVPVLPKIASDQGSQAGSIGVMFAVYAAALLAVTPLAGAWIDRRGNRQPLLVGLFGLGAATLLFAFAHDYPLLLVARGLQGVAAGISWTAALALIAATHPPAERGKAMGIALSCFGVGTLLGPPLGGLLTDWLDPRAPFLFAFVVAVGDGLARWLLVPREFPPTGHGSVSVLRGQPGFVLVVLLTAVGAALIAFLEPILPLHLFETENVGPGAVGLVFGGAAVVAAIGPPLVGIGLRRVPPAWAAAAGCVLAAVALLMLASFSGLWLIGLGLAVVALGASLVLTPTLTVMADLAERREPPAYGSVYALYTVAYAVGLTLAPLIAGLSAGAYGFAGATRLAAVVAGLSAVVLVLVARESATSSMVRESTAKRSGSGA